MPLKDLSATASGVAGAAIERCYALLEDVERYPQWYPTGARSALVLARDGEGVATMVDAVLAVAAGPLRREFRMRLAVQREPPGRIALVRVADDRGDHELLTVVWSLRALGDARTELGVQLSARLDVPRLVPGDAVAREVAGGFLQAALRAL